MNGTLDFADYDLSTLEGRFERFNDKHPEVYRALVKFARKLKARGIERYGMQSLIEVLRWKTSISREPEEVFKINNDYAACYSRRIMENEPDLCGFFENSQESRLSRLVYLISACDMTGAYPFCLKFTLSLASILTRILAAPVSGTGKIVVEVIPPELKRAALSLLRSAAKEVGEDSALTVRNASLGCEPHPDAVDSAIVWLIAEMREKD